MEPLAYELVKEGQEDVMRINYEGASFPPSIENSDLCMMDTIEKLSQVPSVQRIILLQKRNYQYDHEQTTLLREIANIYNHLIKQKKILILSTLSPDLRGRAFFLQDLVLNLLRSDPLGAYVEIKRLMREQKIKLSKISLDREARIEKLYLDLLRYVFDLLDRTQIIHKARGSLAGYRIGDRGLYRQIFRAAITPDFMFTRLMAEPPLDGEELDSY